MKFALFEIFFSSHTKNRGKFNRWYKKKPTSRILYYCHLFLNKKPSSKHKNAMKIFLLKKLSTLLLIFHITDKIYYFQEPLLKPKKILDIFLNRKFSNPSADFPQPSELPGAHALALRPLFPSPPTYSLPLVYPGSRSPSHGSPRSPAARN